MYRTSKVTSSGWGTNNHRTINITFDTADDALTGIKIIPVKVNLKLPRRVRSSTVAECAMTVPTVPYVPYILL